MMKTTVAEVRGVGIKAVKKGTHHPPVLPTRSGSADLSQVSLRSVASSPSQRDEKLMMQNDEVSQSFRIVFFFSNINVMLYLFWKRHGPRLFFIPA